MNASHLDAARRRGLRSYRLSDPQSSRSPIRTHSQTRSRRATPSSSTASPRWSGANRFAADHSTDSATTTGMMAASPLGPCAPRRADPTNPLSTRAATRASNGQPHRRGDVRARFATACASRPRRAGPGPDDAMSDEGADAERAPFEHRAVHRADRLGGLGVLDGDQVVMAVSARRAAGQRGLA